MSRPSKKWLAIADLYKRFAMDFAEYDFSPEAASDMFDHESRGTPLSIDRNGFAIGKSWMDLTVAAWREDILDGLLFKFELVEDGFPKWWIDRVVGDVSQGRCA